MWSACIPGRSVVDRAVSRAWTRCAGEAPTASAVHVSRPSERVMHVLSSTGCVEKLGLLWMTCSRCCGPRSSWLASDRSGDAIARVGGCRRERRGEPCADIDPCSRRVVQRRLAVVDGPESTGMSMDARPSDDLSAVFHVERVTRGLRHAAVHGSMDRVSLAGRAGTARRTPVEGDLRRPGSGPAWRSTWNIPEEDL
jgi:hypothetical protein